MPTKKYLSDRVEQLQRDLARVASERDAARAESGRESREGTDLSSLTQREAKDLMERAAIAEERQQELTRQLGELADQLRSTKGQLSAAQANEERLLAEIEGWKTRLESAEVENQRWLEREQRWTKREERLQQTADKLAGELEVLGAGGPRTLEPSTVSRSDPPEMSAPDGVSVTSSVSKPAAVGQQVPTISNYKGTDAGDEDETIEDWLDQFDLIASVFEWDERVKLMHLTTHLRGSALAYYRSCSPAQRCSYTLLTAALKERFTPIHVQSVQSSLFHGRIQRPQETVESYGQELRKLFQRAYPKMAREESSEGKDILASRFIAGLRRELQEKLTGAVGSFEELVQRARFEEAKRRELHTERREQETSMAPRQQGRQVRDSKGTKNRDQSGERWESHRGNNTRGRGQDNRACHHCGALGHFVRNCPLKGRSEPRESTRPAGVKVLSVGETNSLDAEMITMKTLDVETGQQPTIGRQVTVDVELEGLPVTALVDSGSPVSIVSSLCVYEVHRKLVGPEGDWKLSVKKSKRPSRVAVRAYGDTPVKIDAEADFKIRRGNFEVTAVLLIQCGAPQDLLLGTDLQSALGIKFCLEDGPDLAPVPTPCDDRRPLSSLDPASCGDRKSLVKLLKAIRIPARHVGIVPVTCTSAPIVSECVPKERLFEPERERNEELGIEWAPALVTVSEHMGVEVRNESYSPVTLPAGAMVGYLEPIGEESVIEDLSIGQHDDSDSERVRVEHVNLLASVTESESARDVQLCEALKLSEIPIDMEKRDDIAGLVLEFREVFALSDSELGVTDRAHHYLDVGESTPIKQYARRIPYALRGHVEEAIDDMLQRKVIRPSASPWASPVVLVRKKGGTYRFCVDYRRLNAITKTDVFPLPRIEDYLDVLAGARYFTTLDLASGFWQVPMSPKSIEKTAFVSHAGSYEFTVMPFGLKNAPSTFQRLMSEVLAGLSPKVCMVYIDDILVVGHTFDEHMKNLRAVLQRLREAGLKLKTTKCDLLKTTVKYLGYVVSPDGVEVDPEKTRAVQEFPVPDNVRSLRGFLGLTSYYRRFISAYSKIAKPLHHLTGKNVPYHWDSKCQRAFEDLKRKLVTAPVLVYPNFEVPFILETDASHDGLGAVLAQQQPDGTTRPIAYASRTIQGAETHYASSELEALGVVWATRHFHHYLYGHRCIVYTDNIALKSLLATPHPSGKLARWGLALQELDLSIQHRSGKENRNADALSRYPVEDPREAVARRDCTQMRQGPGCPTKPEPTTTEQKLGYRQGGSTLRNNCLSNDCKCVYTNILHTYEPSSQTGYFENTGQSSALREEQLRDPDLKLYLDYIDHGLVPEDPKVARKLAAERSCYETIEGVLFQCEKDGTMRLIPPTQQREKLIADLHGGVFGAHLGAEKTLGRVRTHYWWESVRRDVYNHCRNCSVCRSRTSGSAPVVPMKPIPVGGPWECVGVDVLKLPRSRGGKEYLVVFQDYLTKWPEAFAVSNQDTLTIARLLVERIVPIHGVPKKLLSDRGGCFLSNLIGELYRLLGIQKINTTAYHPQTDGMVERMNRTLIEMLSKIACKDPRTWDLHLPYALFAYRTSPHDSTKATPFRLMYGREAVLPTNELLLPPKNQSDTFIGTYVEEVTDRMSSAWTLAQQHIKKAQVKQKACHDKKAKEHHFQVGDKVLLYSPKDKTGPLRKLALPNKGPYVIADITPTNVFIVPVDRPKAAKKCVSWDRIRHCPNSMQSQKEIPSVEPTPNPSWKERLRPRVRLLGATEESGESDEDVDTGEGQM